MRHLLPNVRAFLIHSGQVVTLISVAVLAMAAAPALPAEPTPWSVPEAPPTTAVAEQMGPMTRMIAFVAPVRGYGINSAFGLRRLPGQAARQHEGVDIAAPQGTGVFVATEGRVLRTGYEPAGYGRFIEVSHPNGMTTFYAHLKRIDVATGDRVEADARIGLVGSTGRSTGPHLHFEVRRGDRQVNPAHVMGREFQVVVRTAAA